MDRTPQQIVKNKDLPGNKMSSSLRERLKKCGRYHPGTPTSIHSPQTSQFKTETAILNNCMNSPTAEFTPSKDVLQKNHLLSAVEGDTNFRLPSKLKTLKPIKFEDRIKSVDQTIDGNSKTQYSDSCDVGTSTHVLTDDLSKKVSTDTSSDSNCIDPSTSVPQSHSDVVEGDHLQSDPSCQSEDMEELLAVKKTLQSDLLKQEECLRKLKMVKMYREKNNLTELQKLIDTWRDVSQRALTDLLELQPPPQPHMSDLISHLQIDPEFIGYNKEEEGFS
ncbi:swi5-dependent recombination DNA repair protein 1 homolog [Aplysia californica]|uniref:Swi5-dependent recombination DNA repair protein 1 homolog n=1 Tax=Aplysia californica TaxID=6500 RepID=A0ABM0JLE1_APLCA|nr:swi5-dependent recombination DNA repair protein 1 homolog [Aplysia californica]XP_005096444.1 swi5-dependent recombination DNA repair protein 1 homolog [Aplysia californica]